MKPWIPGAAAALTVLAIFPTDEKLSDRWTRALTSGNVVSLHKDSTAHLDESLLSSSLAAPNDSTPAPADPFGLPPEPTTSAPRTTTPIGPELPPPPRIWRATGRVGERAAVLSSPDGRVLVISDGSRVDSAVVVSIGNGGVTLEDRAGRFVLRIP